MSDTHYVDEIGSTARVKRAICGAPTREHRNDPSCVFCVAVLAARAADEEETAAALDAAVAGAERMAPPSPLYGSTEGYQPRGFEHSNETAERRR